MGSQKPSPSSKTPSKTNKVTKSSQRDANVLPTHNQHYTRAYQQGYDAGLAANPNTAAAYEQGYADGWAQRGVENGAGGGAGERSTSPATSIRSAAAQWREGVSQTLAAERAIFKGTFRAIFRRNRDREERQ